MTILAELKTDRAVSRTKLKAKVNTLQLPLLEKELLTLFPWIEKLHLWNKPGQCLRLLTKPT